MKHKFEMILKFETRNTIMMAKMLYLKVFQQYKVRICIRYGELYVLSKNFEKNEKKMESQDVIYYVLKYFKVIIVHEVS